jgi:acetyl esterase/lipase
MTKKIIAIVMLTLISLFSATAQNTTAPAVKSETKTAEQTAPKPDIADGKYGDYAANTFDFWKSKAKKASPLVVFIHGGGLASGDKSSISVNQLNKLLEADFAVMAINYRLTGEAVFPQHYMDSARAIQYARAHAKDLNIDPKKVAAIGGSAGGMTALWLGFHDEMADPKNADPILRESTRLRAMAVSSAQTTLLPDLVTKRIGAMAAQYPSYTNGKLFGMKKDEMTSPKALDLFKQISPLTYLTKDDPPVWAFYSVPNVPINEKSTMSDAIHHPGFGAILKEEMDKLKIECKLRHKDDGQNVNGDMVNFLAKYLK